MTHFITPDTLEIESHFSQTNETLPDLQPPTRPTPNHPAFANEMLWRDMDDFDAVLERFVRTGA